MEMLHEFIDNVRHNLFKPLLLFFYMGFLVPILGVNFEFPHVIYQGLTIYLLLGIGWHGGEELASLTGGEFGQALGFMVVGFITNLIIGICAYLILRGATRLRKIDAATVAGYYGSDSAGTFLTCVGVLSTQHIHNAAYMPVMLAVMEIPGCLVAMSLISSMRRRGMDPHGNMPGEPGYAQVADTSDGMTQEFDLVPTDHRQRGIFDKELMKEVFLNPGIFLLFGGILIGFISQLQGKSVTKADDILFVDLFQGMLCLFLLEMGMTASRRLVDLKTAGFNFIAFAILAPNIFATFGILVAHAYSMAIGVPFEIGTYALFSVLCGAASYIAVPAIQRLAIPEASPTLPLAASLGLTFTYNVTIGIHVYIMIAKAVTSAFPVATAVAGG